MDLVKVAPSEAEQQFWANHEKRKQNYLEFI